MCKIHVHVVLAMLKLLKGEIDKKKQKEGFYYLGQAVLSDCELLEGA